MIIVLEGCDRVGKTTLANELSRNFNAEIHHFSKPKGDPYKEYGFFINGLDPEKNYVLDRFHVGELVYGEIYRGKPALSIDQLIYLDMRLRSFNTVLIHCDSDVETVKSKFIECGEESTKICDVDLVLSKFREKIVLSSLETLSYNWKMSQPDKQALFKKISTFNDMKRLKKEEVVDYVGDSQPEFLFLGDTKNPNKTESGVFDSRSGKFLFRALSNTGFLKTKKIGVTNSDILTIDFYKRLGSPRVICLGKNSLARTTKKGIASVQVYHPQWVFRFGGQDSMVKYRDSLKEVMA